MLDVKMVNSVLSCLIPSSLKLPRDRSDFAPSYDGTRQPNLLKRPLAQTKLNRITKAGMVVKINFLRRYCNFRPVCVRLRRTCLSSGF